MKRATVIPVLLLLGADSAPAGFTADAARAERLVDDVRSEGHFGGEKIGDVAAAFFTADGASLMSWRVATAGPVDRPDEKVGAELDLVHSAARISASDGSRTQEASWDQHVVPDAKTVEATLTWRHLDLGTTSRVRVVITATAQGLEEIARECVLRDDAADEFDAACAAWLAAVAPATDERARVPLAIGTAPIVDQPSADVPSMKEGKPLSTGPVVIVPPKPDTDRRPLYVAGGAMVLAALFLWNRAREKRLAEEHGPTPPRQRRWKKAEGGEETVEADPDAETLGEAADGKDDQEDK